MHRAAPLLMMVLIGCRPEFEDRTSAVSRVRVLAVQSEPPEVATGAAVHYRALVVDDKGTRSNVALDWAYCTRPKPLSVLSDVTIACFAATAEWISPIAVAAEADGTVPNNACRQFGSDIPEPKPGEPPGRPSDPDGTGGYYQPIRLIARPPEFGGNDVPVLALGQTRLQCGLPGATREVLEAFRTGYHPNSNPGIASVVAVKGAESKALAQETDAEAVVVRPGEAVLLRTTWDVCTADMKACKGAEYYLHFDLLTTGLETRRESMRVSWYANAGSYAEERTGRTESETTSSADNTWTAPAAPGTYKIWVVLRDSRNGVDFKALRIDVR